LLSFSLYRLNPYDLILPQPIYATVDAVVEFAEEFTRLEAENSQLRKTIRSSADQVLEANRLATDAKNENVLLKEEVKKLKQRLKDELDAKNAAAAAIDKKEGALREPVRDLLGNSS
jgi:regulator of replication initiation timing